MFSSKDSTNDEEKGDDDDDDDEDDEEDDEKEDLWDSGDVGGYECYIAAEEEALEAAEVFEREVEDEGDDEHQDASSTGSGDDQLLSISAGHNVLSLVMRNENIMRFVKYVGANAVGSRWDISMDYAIDFESLEGQEQTND